MAKLQWIALGDLRFMAVEVAAFEAGDVPVAMGKTVPGVTVVLCSGSNLYLHGVTVAEMEQALAEAGCSDGQPICISRSAGGPDRTISAPVVVEWHNEDGVEWGVSFEGHNPDSEHWVPVADAATAFKLKGLVECLQLYGPQLRATTQSGVHVTNSAGSNVA